MHPARRQRSAVQTGTRFVSLRENKQCPVSLKQLNQYSGEGARPRGPHPHTAKKGPRAGGRDTRNAPALSTRTRRDHTRSEPPQARSAGMGEAHLSTRMRRDHTRQGNRNAHNSRGGPTKGGCAVALDQSFAKFFSKFGRLLAERNFVEIWGLFGVSTTFEHFEKILRFIFAASLMRFVTRSPGNFVRARRTPTRGPGGRYLLVTS